MESLSDIGQINVTSATMPSIEVHLGINNLFDDYVSLKPSDHVIVSFWHEADETAAWLGYELKNRQISHQFHVFDHRNENQYINEIELLVFPQKKQKIIILVCENKKLSFTKFLKDLSSNTNIDVWRIMNSCEDLFSQSLMTKRGNIHQINSSLIKKLQSYAYQSLRYECAQGTELAVKFDYTKYNWISKNGFPDKNDFITFPIGEISIFPVEVNGVYVTTGAVHTNISLPFDSCLRNNRIKLLIENSIIKSFHCENPQIMDFLTRVFEYEYVKKVDEFSIGTNIGVSNFIADNSHINERFPGVHLGVGQHQSSPSMNAQENIHIDFINPYGILKLENGEKIDLSQLGLFIVE